MALKFEYKGGCKDRAPFGTVIAPFGTVIL